ncbi:MAG: DNA-processing protein DprA [Candidatus Omnitrophica bacterium]|nr:DNA-processing protein DprA [Candidatus Omnitrophota bacterium]
MNSTCCDLMALSFVDGLGPRRILSIINKVPEGKNIFLMPDFKIAEIISNLKTIDKIKKVKDTDEYKRELEYVQKEKISVLCLKDKEYSCNLKSIYDPPAVLYCKGDFLDADINAVAIVGSRRCSLYGQKMAKSLAADLAKKGITVVSGMARGIDIAAHRGALEAGGRTIAVMGSGFRHIYPVEAKPLIEEICHSGAVITEYSSETHPLRQNFPRRNRIVSGLVKAVVVVEAAERSGAMITVDFALEQGREVFAVPGRVDSYAANGSNKLIQDGAKLVMSAEDILNELNLEKIDAIKRSDKEVTVEVLNKLDNEERMVLDLISIEKNAHIDDILEQTNLDPGRVHAAILKMQMKRLIKEIPGKYFALTNEKLSRKG